MKVIVKILSIIERIFSICLALGFGCVSAIVLIQILARYIPGLTAPWTDELGRLMFFYTMMFGAPLAFSHGEYAFIDVFINMVHGKARHILNAAIYALCTGTAAVIFFNSFKFFNVGFKTASTALRLPMVWFYFPIVALFGFSAVGAGCVVLRELYYAVKGEGVQ